MITRSSKIASAFITLMCLCEYGKSTIGFPEFTADEHPLNRFSVSTNQQSIEPVVMKKYYFTARNGWMSAEAASFVPRSLTYVHFPNGSSFLTNADVLNTFAHYLPRPASADNVENNGKIHLNYPARVFAIMQSFSLWRKPKSSYTPLVQGVPRSWKLIGPVRTLTGSNVWLGDPKRLRHHVKGYAVAMEVPLSADNVVTVPYPHSIFIDGHYVRHIAFAFTRPDMSTIPAPRIPAPFQSRLHQRTVNPLKDLPIPNTDCPEWLHDAYVVPNKNPLDAAVTGEPAFWRTWHPSIDPVYWCYFDHEHGSFPGKNYRPSYGYTSFKNLGSDQTPEDESHGGFKTFSIPQADGRVVVMTAHMHMASARRFTTRHHTIIFTVLSGPNGAVEMELFMKADFGPGTMYMKQGRIPIDTEQEKIFWSSKDSVSRGDRIFNVLNIDDDFPNSLDRDFLIKGNLYTAISANNPRYIQNGLYEQWKAPLASCAGPVEPYIPVFVFDIRDPSTAMRNRHTRSDEDMQEMNGQALKRILMIRGKGVEVATGHCLSSAMNRSSDGTFYTDPYFKSVVDGPSNQAIKQFIAPAFQRLVLKQGLLRAHDCWSGWYKYNGESGLQHIEKATIKLKN